MDNRKPIRKSVTLTVVNSCNLACSYCYEHHKDGARMTFETATAIIERHLNSESTDYDEVEIDLFGGEPFVNFPLMREICEYTWQGGGRNLICFLLPPTARLSTAQFETGYTPTAIIFSWD